jgi:hypothetical protein
MSGRAASLPDAAPDRTAVLALLSQSVASALRAGRHEVAIRLSPPDLGSLHLRFAFEEGGVTARLEVSEPSVHKALESGLAELRATLRQHRVDLADLALAPRHESGGGAGPDGGASGGSAWRGSEEGGGGQDAERPATPSGEPGTVARGAGMRPGGRALSGAHGIDIIA